jgi:hypothetical protein
MATSITKRITPGYPQAEAIRNWIYHKLSWKRLTVALRAQMEQAP